MEMSVIKLAIGTMDEKCEMANLRGIIKTSDTSKYNLRCNRNISEKMTKKDFIYDIRRPISGTRKLVEGQKRQIVLPIQLRRKTVPDSKMPQYTVITTKNDNGGGGDAGMMPERRDLGFECNFCHEPIATLLSLSTHVKFHCQRYCKMCYWILREDETMDQHIEHSHRIRPGITVNL
ncbi:uncharacterized protein LOC107270592 isoform X1 [Cephus cinctus]|uniref:Uncharacterized protein LOC107270592 isoform X1 n=1 Tax=Cephus cinctus TaxID=211228 RepID=A0AAJ7C3P1_CEPCN|nr:uncharacterized protein LOC107270592 isoform X1 [Cephus cinctus]